ncbi:MAG: hypothetical protein PHO20_04765 [Candidatus Peribacteraceae bacterium]|nr:hypothetical protein [Candidatus Peribacteraceae bacterium]MDD5740049.1 hypothetical protein [Candidatus Peribacteraceae bacterium]
MQNPISAAAILPRRTESSEAEREFENIVAEFNSARGSGFEYSQHLRNPENNPSLCEIERRAARAYVDLVSSAQDSQCTYQEQIASYLSRWGRFWFPNSGEERRMRLLIEQEWVRQLTRPEPTTSIWIPDIVSNVRERLRATADQDSAGQRS